MSRMMDEILKDHAEIQAAKDDGDAEEVLHLVDQAIIRAEEDAVGALDQLIRDTRADETPAGFERIGGIIAAARIMGLDITEVHYLYSDGEMVDDHPTYGWWVCLRDIVKRERYSVSVRVTLIPETKEAYFDQRVEFPNHIQTVDSGFVPFDGLPDHIRNCLYGGIDILSEAAVRLDIPFDPIDWEDNNEITKRAYRALQNLIEREE